MKLSMDRLIPVQSHLYQFNNEVVILESVITLYDLGNGP